MADVKGEIGRDGRAGKSHPVERNPTPETKRVAERSRMGSGDSLSPGADAPGAPKGLRRDD